MPQPSSDPIFNKPSGHQVGAVESDMFSFRYWIGFVMRCALSIVCVRDGLMKFGQELFVQLQDLADVVLNGCSRVV